MVKIWGSRHAQLFRLRGTRFCAPLRRRGVMEDQPQQRLQDADGGRKAGRRQRPRETVAGPATGARNALRPRRRAYLQFLSRVGHHEAPDVGNELHRERVQLLGGQLHDEALRPLVSLRLNVRPGLFLWGRESKARRKACSREGQTGMPTQISGAPAPARGSALTLRPFLLLPMVN